MLDRIIRISALEKQGISLLVVPMMSPGCRNHKVSESLSGGLSRADHLRYSIQASARASSDYVLTATLAPPIAEPACRHAHRLQWASMLFLLVRIGTGIAQDRAGDSDNAWLPALERRRSE